MVVRPDLPWADIEDVLIAYLEAVTQETADTEAPEDGKRGYSVARVDGEDDGITDHPRVELASFAETRREVRQLSEDARQHMLALGGQAVSMPDGATVTIDYCRTDVGPESGRYDNPDRRFQPAYYVLGLRRPRRR